MAWIAAANVPFVPTTNLYFSPVIGAEVYVIDRGSNFWKYNIGTGTWTHLPNPPFVGDPYRQLTYRNNRLYCLDDAIIVNGEGPASTRISIYNIALNSWTSTSRVPQIAGVMWWPRSLCFSDDDTIWVWTLRQFTYNQMRVWRYVISTDTWTSFAATTGVQPTTQGRAAVHLGGVVYGAHIGNVAGAGRYCLYTIATDTYAFSAVHQVDGVDVAWAWGSDPDRLWYMSQAGLAGTFRPGYLTIATGVFTDNYWPANALRVGGWFGFMNVNGITSVVDQAGNVNPMVYYDGVVVPTVQTNPATQSMSFPQLNGIVTGDGGLVCEGRFEYGLTPALGSFTPWLGGISTGNSFSQVMTGLAAGSMYYFRAQARNATGTIVSGATLSFTVAKGAMPTVATLEATEITESGARLNGMVGDDLGIPGRVRFEYGGTIDYGSFTAWQEGVATGAAFSAVIGGLADGSACHFRARFENRAGGAYGQDKSFSTLSAVGPFTLIGDEIVQILEAA